jgi:hypothetical protein
VQKIVVRTPNPAHAATTDLAQQAVATPEHRTLPDRHS